LYAKYRASPSENRDEQPGCFLSKSTKLKKRPNSIMNKGAESVRLNETEKFKNWNNGINERECFCQTAKGLTGNIISPFGKSHPLALARITRPVTAVAKEPDLKFSCLLTPPKVLPHWIQLRKQIRDSQNNSNSSSQSPSLNIHHSFYDTSHDMIPISQFVIDSLNFD
jgi:hypothetical protein